MTNDLGHDGMSSSALWGASWVLGILAVGCAVRLATFAADGTQVHSEHFVWLILGVLAGAFSAACTVLTGLRSMEQRMTRN